MAPSNVKIEQCFVQTFFFKMTGCILNGAFERKAICPAVREAIVDVVRLHVRMRYSTIIKGCSDCQIEQCSVLFLSIFV